MIKFVIGVQNLKLISFKFNVQRTLMSETKLKDDTMLLLIEVHRNRKSEKLIYRIMGTYNALIICKNHNSSYITSVTIENCHFSPKKEYARVVQMLSRTYNVPFEIGLALGTDSENYKLFCQATTWEKLSKLNIVTVADLFLNDADNKLSVRKEIFFGGGS